MSSHSGEQETTQDRARNFNVRFGKQEMARDSEMSFHSGEQEMTHDREMKPPSGERKMITI